MEHLAHPMLLAAFLVIQAGAVGYSSQFAKNDLSLAASFCATGLIVLTMLIATFENAGWFFMSVHLGFIFATWLCMIFAFANVQQKILLAFVLLSIGLAVSGGVASHHALLVWAMNVVAAGSVLTRYHGIRTVLDFPRGGLMIGIQAAAWLVALVEKREWLEAKGLLAPLEGFVSVLVLVIPAAAFAAGLTWLVVGCFRGYKRIRKFARGINLSPSTPLELNQQLQADKGA